MVVENYLYALYNYLSPRMFNFVFRELFLSTFTVALSVTFIVVFQLFSSRVELIPHGMPIGREIGKLVDYRRISPGVQ